MEVRYGMFRVKKSACYHLEGCSRVVAGRRRFQVYLCNTYSRIPLVRSSSELVVHRTGKSSKLHPLDIRWAAREVRSVSRSLPQLHQVSSKDSQAQPSEPILFPKVRIYFADFPVVVRER